MSLLDHVNTAIQHMLPQRAITAFFRAAANCPQKTFKNWMIRRFIREYGVNMEEAIIQNPESYKTFNEFFIRKLKSEYRPMETDEQAIVSPVDGCVRQLGKIEKGKIFNAKGFPFTLYELLGGELARALPFFQGTYINLYLAPCDYHCVHMPYAGNLKKMIYIPGKLFSVKESTVNLVPTLFSQNERLVLIFDTDIGPMAVILVGAMIVGNLHVVWHGDVTREKNIREWDYTKKPLRLEKGDEVGHFKLGSTVITLFTNKSHLIQWSNDLEKLCYGQKIGVIAPVVSD